MWSAADSWHPLYSCGLILVPEWISDHIHSKVLDEITYPFQNFNVGEMFQIGSQSTDTLYRTENES